MMLFNLVARRTKQSQFCRARNHRTRSWCAPPREVGTQRICRELRECDGRTARIERVDAGLMQTRRSGWGGTRMREAIKAASQGDWARERGGLRAAGSTTRNALERRRADATLS